MCPTLPKLQFGEYDPADCTNHKSAYGSNCTVVCHPGFEVKGPNNKLCGGKRSGIWSNKSKAPKCVDVTPPQLECPANYSIPLEPNDNFALLKEFKPVEVSDNSEMNVTVWTKPVLKEDGIKLNLGSHNFTYVAVDVFKNKAKCNFTVTVIDKTPPVLENCFDQEFYVKNSQVKDKESFIEWEDPIIFDYSNGNLTVEKSLQFGFLSFGVHSVNYKVTDEAGNSNQCSLNITVKGLFFTIIIGSAVEPVEDSLTFFLFSEQLCSPLLSPINGTSICAKNSTNMWCEVTCNIGHGLYDVYDEVLLENFTLNCEHDLAKWKYDSIPDCSLLDIPTTVDELFSVSFDSEAPICDDPEIQKEILANLKEQLCGDQEDCEIASELPECLEEVDEEKEVDETTHKSFYSIVKRETGRMIRNRPRTRTQMKINVYTKVGKKLGLWSQNTTRTENIKHLRSEFRHLNKNEKLRKKLEDLKIDLTVLKLDELIRCQNGSVAKKMVCVPCPIGTFHNKTAKNCQSCPMASYNHLPGQTSCIQCPLNHSTRKRINKSPFDCKELCPPGTMARIKVPRLKRQNQILHTSLMPFCKKCGPGEYQSFYDQTKCEKCPEGFISPRGSRFFEDCVPKIIQPCLKNPLVCGRNGYCVPEGTNNYLYSCLCDEGYIGSHCETQVNICWSRPCLNGGTCSYLNESLSCDCSKNFTGEFCEFTKEICDENTCKNDGACTDENGKAICDCSTGFMGDFCEIQIDYCLNHPCEAGNCINKNDGFFCDCPPGIIGRRCHLRPCDYFPCHKNSICADLLLYPASKQSFDCLCPKGLKGMDCSQLDSPCDKNPCRNNGRCEAILRNSSQTTLDENIFDQFSCKCPAFFYGENCEIFTTPDFVLDFEKASVSNFVQLEGPKENLNEISFCCWIQTNDSFNYGAVLSYASSSSDNMFTFTDYNGFVLYVNGNHIVTDITINDGLWHFICVTWTSLSGFYEVYLDGSLHQTGYNLSSGNFIESGGSLVLGQEQDDLGSSFSESESFIGKIAYLDIWDYSIRAQDVYDYFSTCEPYQGNLIPWTDFKSKIKGEVKVLSSPFCKTCPENISLENGFIRVMDNKAFYICNDGFKLSEPSNVRYCLRTSEWELPAPFCKMIQCNYMENLSNGFIYITKSSQGGQAFINCNEGYILSGQSLRTCLSNNSWSGTMPECISKIQCSPLEPQPFSLIFYATENGPINEILEKYPIGTLAEINCLNGTVIDGENFLTCNENGLWDMLVPNCVVLATTENEMIFMESTTEEILEKLNISRIYEIVKNSKTVPDKLFWKNLKEFLYSGCLNPIKDPVFCSKCFTKPNLTDLTNFESPDSEEFQNMDTKLLELLERAVAQKLLDSNPIPVEILFEYIMYGGESMPDTIGDSIRLVLSFYIDRVIIEKETTFEVAVNEQSTKTTKIKLFLKFLSLFIYEQVFEEITTTMVNNRSNSIPNYLIFFPGNIIDSYHMQLHITIIKTSRGINHFK